MMLGAQHLAVFRVPQFSTFKCLRGISDIVPFNNAVERSGVTHLEVTAAISAARALVGAALKHLISPYLIAGHRSDLQHNRSSGIFGCRTYYCSLIRNTQ